MTPELPPQRALWKYDFGLLVGVVVLYQEVLFGSARVVGRDVLQYLVPVGALLHDGYRNGTGALLWDSGIDHGLPVAARWAPMVFYPAQWLHAFFDPLTTISFGIIVHLFIAALAMFRLCLRFTPSVTAAWLGGFSFAYGGYLISVSVGGGYLFGATLLPLSLLCFHRLADVPTLARALPVACVVALQVVCADPQTLFYEGLILVPLILLHPDQTRGPVLRRFAMAGVATAIGVGVSACQWLPAGEFSKYSIRANGLTYEEAIEWSFHPARIVQLISPHVLGDVTPQNTFWARGLVNSRLTIPWAPYLYNGLLVVAGLLALKRTRTTLVLAGVAGFFLVMSLGTFAPIFQVVRLLPVASVFRYPEKFLLFVSLTLCALGSVGLGRWLAALTSTEVADVRLRRRFGIMLGSVAVAVGGLRVWLDPAARLEWFTEVIKAQGSMVGPAKALATTASSVLHTAAVAAVIAVVCLVAPRLRPSLVSLLAILIGVADILPESLTQRYLADGDWYAAPTTPAACEVFHPSPTGLRPIVWRYEQPLFFVEDPTTAPPGPRYERQRFWEWNTLMANVGSMYCIRHAQGYEAARLYSYFQLWHALGDDLPRRLRLFGVADVIAAPMSLDESKYPVVFGSNALHTLVQSVADPLPYAHAVGRAEAAPSFEAAKKRILEPSFDFEHSALFERAAAPTDHGDAPRRAEVLEHRHGDVHLGTDFAAPGYLVLQETFYPGWRADADGVPLTVERANGTFLGLEVPAGPHTVHLVFDPPIQRRANTITLAALAVLLALTVWAYLKSRREKMTTAATRNETV